MSRIRWVLAGQLGDAFDDGGRTLLIEAKRAFARRPMHRQKAHLYLSALRHRAQELGDRAVYTRAETFGEVLQGRRIEVIDPTSYRARRLVRTLDAEILPSRGFVTSESDFAAFIDEEPHAAMDDFYRWVRRRTGILMEGDDHPAGGRWNFDADNRHGPPKGAPTLGLPDPWWPEEDDIDADVRRTLDRWERDGDVRLIGDDAPRRFAVTPDEARRALADFVETRLNDFGPFEDAILTSDWTMAHSLLSVPMNLGVLDPREAVDAVLAAGEAGAPLASVEGFTRQVVGWREWMWHSYWRFGEDYVHRNALAARRAVPRPLRELDPDAIEEECLSRAVRGVRENGWAHHIQRLMVIGNHALQRGYRPSEMNEWFTAMFVDGTPWVMPANVVGMTLHADGGRVATKPYAAGGAYIDRMSDHCGRCRFDPKKRLGEDACPYTAGYWAFLDRVEATIVGNHRMAQPLAGLRRLKDRDEVVDQERRRPPLGR